MKIQSLITDIENKALVLPEFQRDFEWNKEEVKKYVKSLYNNHPTGSLLIWRSKESPKLKGNLSPSEGVYTKILLDGQQRLTSIYTLIKGEAPPYYENKKLYFPVYFNLENEEFRYYQKTIMKDKPGWISFTEFFQSGGAGKFIENAPCDNKNYYVSKLSLLNKLDKIRDYDYLIEKEDKLPPDLQLKKVVEIFNLVNKEGRKLQEEDLALAYLCVHWPELKENFRAELYAMEKRGFCFEKSKESPGLNFLVLCFNAVLTNHSLFNHIYEYSDRRQLEEAWGKAKKSLDYVLNILYDEACFHSFRVYELKTPAILVPIVVYLSKNNYSFKDEKILKKFLYWMYLALLWGRYSKRGKSTPLEQDVVAISKRNTPDVLIDNLRRQIRDFEVKASDLEGAWVTNPIFNLSFVVAKSNGAIDWFNGTKLHSVNIGEQYELERHHIFPQKVLKRAGYYETTDKKRLVNEITNRAFLTEKANREILDTPPKDYLPEVVKRYPKALKQQFIPENEELWKVENFEEFLKQRRVLITKEINKFLKKLIAGDEPKINIKELINEEEGETFELKSTFKWNVKEKRVDKELRYSILKTVVSFMNSIGGMLVIGVEDNHTIRGLDRDYQTTLNKNKDGFLLELEDYLSAKLGQNNYLKYIKTEIHEIDGKDICLIEVQKGLKWLYLTKDGVKTFYIRSGNKTKPLTDPEEIHEYIKQNWEDE